MFGRKRTNRRQYRIVVPLAVVATSMLSQPSRFVRSPEPIPFTGTAKRISVPARTLVATPIILSRFIRSPELIPYRGFTSRIPIPSFYAAPVGGGGAYIERIKDRGVAQAPVVFSGDPLPLAPLVQDSELAKFHRDLLNYLHRLGSRLDAGFNSNSGSLETLMLYYNDDTTIGTNFAILDWPVVGYRHNLYDLKGGRITPKESGLYFFDFTLDLPNQNGTDLVSSQITYEKNGSTLGTLIFGDTKNKSRTHHVAVTVPIAHGQTVFIEAKSANGEVVSAGGTRLVVYRVAPSVFHGDSGGGTRSKNLGNVDADSAGSIVKGTYIHVT